MFVWLSRGSHAAIVNNFEWTLYSHTTADHCLLYDERLFCRDQHAFLTETFLCPNKSIQNFSLLQRNNVSTDHLLSWRIPFETVERYAHYLNTNITEDFICNCTPDRIGPACQYILFSDQPTIEDILKQQLRDPQLRSYALFTCLVDSIQCNAGLLCLEWRQVCDGIAHCDNGMDEVGCHLLEFEQCLADEFQCRNSMCIPIEFLFDGAVDCMDLSDEQELTKIQERFSTCTGKSTWLCDERVCRKDEFSCGDGQCIHWSSLIHRREGCKNGRNLAYHCEVENMITLSTGICFAKRSNILPPLKNSTSCTLGLSYLLLGLSRKDALDLIKSHCPDFIEYPEKPVLSPVLQFFYDKSRIVSFYNNHSLNEKLTKSTADFFCLRGTFMCNGILATLSAGHCWSYEEYLSLGDLPFFPISYLFCQMVEHPQENSLQCMYSSLQTRQPSIMNSQIFSCDQSMHSMSLRRINDGYFDCLSGEDERNDVYEMTQPYRYRCFEPSITQYVSYQQLGNGIEECLDGSDELSNEINWFYFRCEFGEEYPCWVFRGTNFDHNNNNNKIEDVRLPFHRHCDSIWDARGGRDEKNCSQWACPPDMYQCPQTGQCINQMHVCDGDFDCENGEDELNCSSRRPRWILEDRCDGFVEHFCITSDFLVDQILHRPCIDYRKAGDGRIDCLGGRDERNVFSCSDHLMLGDRFLCDNATKCLSHTVICNGIIDCDDQTDELICFWNRHHCPPRYFACSNGSKCYLSRCNSQLVCPSNEHLFWCPNPSESVYRANKVGRRSNYNLLCNSQTLSNTPAGSTSPANSKNIPLGAFHGYCNRGFYLLVDTEKEGVCFCPPSFYGNRCQFDRRRVTVRIRFDRRHRSDLPLVLHVLVLLLYNDTFIIDHQRFVDIDEDFPQKHTAYLLYSSPNLTGNYVVRFEAYHELELLSIWEYSITTIGFPPVFQLAKILRFPDRSLPWRCMKNRCQNNGTCYVVVNQDENHGICLCQSGWTGNLCDRPLGKSRCSSNALARNEDVCVCPQGYLPPHCFVRNTICERLPPICSTDQVCLPFSVLLPDGYLCMRDSSTTTELQQAILMLNRQRPNQQAFLLQLLKVSADYPRLRQQILVQKSTGFPVRFTINTRDPVYNITLPEIGLLYTYEPQTEFVIIHLSILYINCSNAMRNLSIDLDFQPSHCRPIFDSPPVKLLNNYCSQFSQQKCFYTEHYICYCREKSNRSECLSYQQRNMACTHCINQGYCIQGNLQNSSDFACVCPKCVSGDLCQFATSRFSIELEMLIEQTQGNRLHLLAPSLFFFIGWFFNALVISTFMKHKARKAGTGLYLLINGIISQLVITLLLTRVIYLVLARQMTIDSLANQLLCKAMPYLMTTLRNISVWLMAFVTVERALAVTWPIKSQSLRTPRFAMVLTTIVFVCLFTSLYGYIAEYKLVTRPNDPYASCIREIPVNRKIVVQYTSLVHQLAPFLINFFAGLMVIINIGRSKATSHHISSRSTIAKQARQRADLLIGPFICFNCALPQLIILFLDACTYESSVWFVNLTLVTYYFSFTPQIIIFFIYIVPSPIYKHVLLDDTMLGKWLVAFVRIQKPKRIVNDTHR